MPGGDRTGRPRRVFAHELAAMKELILKSPGIGTVYATLDGEPVRRLLMEKTGNHLYYSFDSRHNCIIVAVWGGPKKHGPEL
jgi:hypothetical protein